ncbi:MAG: hypothetical protein A2176_13820 [Spirochaetes bacterium RBG_13_51_14]|nr:MAG: hypothetical protein A2176_13820 [Spirochaetes bacterium RBG_13_51_14]
MVGVSDTPPPVGDQETTVGGVVSGAGGVVLTLRSDAGVAEFDSSPSLQLTMRLKTTNTIIGQDLLIICETPLHRISFS